MVHFLEISLRCLATSLKNFSGDAKSSSDVKNFLSKLLVELASQRIKQVDITACKSCALYFDDEAVHSFSGKLHFDRLESSLIHRIVQRFCEMDEFQGIWLNFPKELTERTILYDTEIEPQHSIPVISFSLGTIINYCKFLHHFDSSGESSNVAGDDIIANFKHDHQMLTVKFRISTTCGRKISSTRYKLEFRYKHMKTLLVKSSQEHVYMYIAIRCPPSLYVLVDDVNRTLEVKDVHTDDIAVEDWVRVKTFDNIDSEILGRSNVLRLQLAKILDKKKIPGHKIVCCPLSMIGNLQYFGNIDVNYAFINEERFEGRSQINVHSARDCFGIQYAIKCVESLSYQFSDDLSNNKHLSSCNKLVEKHLKNPESVENAFFNLFYILQRDTHTRVLYTLQKLLEKNEDMLWLENRELPAETKMIRRAIITPSKVLFLPKFPFVHSRFLNMTDPEFVLRVQFRDENLDSISFSQNDVDDVLIKRYEAQFKKKRARKPDIALCNGDMYNFVEDRIQRNHDLQESFRTHLLRIVTIKRIQSIFFNECIKQRLLNGLAVVNRSYEYVGSSNSQLRTHSLFLYAKDNSGKEAAVVRLGFGTIDEKNVSKYVARVGLAMSQALTYVPLGSARIREIEDIKSPRINNAKQYTFSDGVGMISKSLATKVFEHIKSRGILNDETEVPSAFQIRLGGCKGMLTVNPCLEGDEICIRPSMKKYECDDMNSLGIVKTSRPANAYLNKPFITLLEQLGTKRAVILELLSDQLKDLSRCYTSVEATTRRLKEMYFRNVSMEQFHGYGMNILAEPFFIDLAEASIRLHLTNLKEKMRVKIPSNKGRTMLGVLDETFTLEYGQIFIQPTELEGSPNVITGTVMVTKFPCLHPGDIRLLEAVDVVALRHIKDCIVFPAKGCRPHPDEMAGSDLDGDEYAVIWDDKFFISKAKEPMDYQGADPLLVREITIDKILDFYITYTKDFCVGQIASAHLAWADQLKDGIFDEKCLRLAEKHAVSVDFPKTGLNETLTRYERVYSYPDFMEKFRYKSTYLSTRLLGVMYRKVCFAESGFTGKSTKKPQYQANPLLYHERWADFKEEATKAYYCYRTMAEDIQNSFQLESEASLICGVMPRSDGAFAELDDTYSLNKVLRILRRNMRDCLREKFFSTGDRDAFLAKASAWYKVTSDMARTSDKPYFGLPWIVSDFLIELIVSRRHAQINGMHQIRGAQFYPHASRLLDEHPILGRLDEYGVKEKARILMHNWLDNRTEVVVTGVHSLNAMKTSITNHIDAINEDVENTTVGEIILKLLKKYSKKALLPVRVQLFNVEVVLGQLALKTLRECFTTCSVEPIINTSTSRNYEEILMETFQITFSKDNPRWQGYLTRHPDEFFETLKGLTNCREVYASWNKRTSNSYYFRITAVGSRSTLNLLGLILAFWMSRPREKVEHLSSFLTQAVF